MTPSGSRERISRIAQATAGAVFRPLGSPRMFPAGSSGRCSPTRPRCSSAATTSVRSAGASGAARSNVAWIMLRSPATRRNCFGRSPVLSGQNRVPAPPARITTHVCSRSRDMLLQHRAGAVFPVVHPLAVQLRREPAAIVVAVLQLVVAHIAGRLAEQRLEIGNKLADVRLLRRFR